MRPLSASALDALAVLVVAAALAVLAGRIGRGVQSPSDWLIVLAMLAAGYLLADAVTGLVHWFCDTFFDVSTPVIGPGLIAPFREHHHDPLLMTQHGFLELTGSSFRGLAPLLAFYVWQGSGSIGLDAFVFSVSAGAAGTNLLHRWAHEPNPPGIARVLHRAGLVLTPARHARHHAPPYEAAYCVTSGWLNPLFERLGVWTRAEAALVAMGLPRRRA
jgi:hypothetical protein